MNNEFLLWLDIETSGLDPLKHEIIQIAYILTDFSITKVYDKKEYIINPIDPYDLLISKMDTWCLLHHSKNGILEKVKDSTDSESLINIENKILESLNSLLPNNSVIYLAGNSVHFDKMFINHYMKKLSDKLSHRILDVSSFAIMCKNLNPILYEKKPTKEYNHTALSDIQESIQEYKFYMKYFINLNESI